MNTWFIIGIVALVLGVIVSNILLLRSSTKFNLPPNYRAPEKEHDDTDDSASSAFTKTSEDNNDKSKTS
ncbi:DUF2897 family protein [Aestuariibacter sp. GS-14]|uniref:DUF2897 family protein n=1 Tax=Alteromonadaceae TaxID=72275 RepID=UPI00112E5491|nr:DUF2897 family protein [Aestuariibacter sp. GS-14]TPV55434.1 DUF2897 family protein [Aestuariibacter sp. GS-14]